MLRRDSVFSRRLNDRKLNLFLTQYNSTPPSPKTINKKIIMIFFFKSAILFTYSRLKSLINAFYS